MSEKLKPVRCGCGGEAKVISYLSREYFKMAYYVRCENCGTETDDLHSEAEAIEVWNRAMGAGKNEVAITKGYWMVTYDGLHCSVCNYKCETTAPPKVCPHCRTKLDWSGNE